MPKDGYAGFTGLTPALFAITSARVAVIAAIRASSAAIARQEAALTSRAAGILDLTDLAALRDAPAGTLSGGQKKLLELARALMADPRLILLDEPGAGVNPTLMARSFAPSASCTRAE